MDKALKIPDDQYRYMKRFYELVSDASEKLPQIGAKLLTTQYIQNSIQGIF